ncbi:hypothetical protein ANO14919_094670 [Xylariales sp. No.14919]|nr:hypothetical protein ANO14919_094670 [Xylariales sp. No.14919]
MAEASTSMRVGFSSMWEMCQQRLELLKSELQNTGEN